MAASVVELHPWEGTTVRSILVLTLCAFVVMQPHAKRSPSTEEPPQADALPPLPRPEELRLSLPPSLYQRGPWIIPPPPASTHEDPGR